MTIVTDILKPVNYAGRHGVYMMYSYKTGKRFELDFGCGCLVLYPDSTATPEEYGDDYPKVTHEEFMDNNWCVDYQHSNALAYRIEPESKK